MLTVTFRNGYRDTVRAVRSINGVLPRIRFLRRLSYVCFALFIILSLLGVPRDWTFLLLLIPAVILPLLWVIPLYAAWLNWKNPTSEAEQRFTFSDEGIEAVGAASEAHVQWSAVTRVGETKRHLVFFTSGQCGYAIPKHALPDAGAVSWLRDLLQRNAGKPDAHPVTSQDAPSGPVIASADFEWTRGELYRAIRATSRYGPKQWPIYAFLLLLAWWTGGARALEQWRTGGWRAVDLWAVLLALYPLLFTILAVRLSSLWAAFSLTRNSPSHDGVQTLSITDAGLKTRGNLYTGQIGWAALLKAVETNEFFLLYVSKAQAVIVPKRVLDAASIGGIRETVHAHLGTRASLLGSPV